MKNFATLLLAAALWSCNEAPAPAPDDVKTSISKEERNKNVVASTYENLQKLDPAPVYENMAADIIDYGDGSMAPVKGIDSVKVAIGQWIGNMSSMKVDNMKMIAEGNDVWVSGDFKGTYKEDMWGMPLKGKSFTIFDVDMFTLNEEGKITSHRSVQAPETWYTQLGIPIPKK